MTRTVRVSVPAPVEPWALVGAAPSVHPASCRARHRDPQTDRSLLSASSRADWPMGPPLVEAAPVCGRPETGARTAGPPCSCQTRTDQTSPKVEPLRAAGDHQSPPQTGHRTPRWAEEEAPCIAPLEVRYPRRGRPVRVACSPAAAAEPAVAERAGGRSSRWRTGRPTRAPQTARRRWRWGQAWRESAPALASAGGPGRPPASLSGKGRAAPG